MYVWVGFSFGGELGDYHTGHAMNSSTASSANFIAML